MFGDHIAARGVAIISWVHAHAQMVQMRALHAAAGVKLEATEKAAAMPCHVYSSFVADC